MRQAGEDYERLVRARDTLLDPLRNVIYLFSGAGGLARMLPVSVPSETHASCPSPFCRLRSNGLCGAGTYARATHQQVVGWSVLWARLRFFYSCHLVA